MDEYGYGLNVVPVRNRFIFSMSGCTLNGNFPAQNRISRLDTMRLSAGWQVLCVGPLNRHSFPHHFY